MSCANSLLKYKNPGEVTKKIAQLNLLQVSYNNASFLIAMPFFFL